MNPQKLENQGPKPNQFAKHISSENKEDKHSKTKHVRSKSLDMSTEKEFLSFLEEKNKVEEQTFRKGFEQESKMEEESETESLEEYQQKQENLGKMIKAMNENGKNKFEKLEFCLDNYFNHSIFNQSEVLKSLGLNFKEAINGVNYFKENSQQDKALYLLRIMRYTLIGLTSSNLSIETKKKTLLEIDKQILDIKKHIPKMNGFPQKEDSEEIDYEKINMEEINLPEYLVQDVGIEMTVEHLHDFIEKINNDFPDFSQNAFKNYESDSF